MLSNSVSRATRFFALSITLGVLAFPVNTAWATALPSQFEVPLYAGAGVGWQPDMKTAVKLATPQNKLVFVEVTATWCPACRKLDHDVMPKAEVSQFLNERFVSVRVDRDSPSGGVLAKMFSLKGVPSLLIFDSRGQLLGKMAGAPRSAQDFKIMITNLIGGEAVLSKYGPAAASPASGMPAASADSSFQDQATGGKQSSDGEETEPPATTATGQSGWMPQTHQQSLQRGPTSTSSNPASGPQPTRSATDDDASEEDSSPPAQQQFQQPPAPQQRFPQQLPQQPPQAPLYPPQAQQAPMYAAPMAVPAWHPGMPPIAVPAWHPGLQQAVQQAPMQFPPGSMQGWYQPPVQMHPAAMPGAMPWQPAVVPQWMPAQPGLMLPGAMPTPWPAYSAPYGYPMQYPVPQQQPQQ